MFGKAKNEEFDCLEKPKFTIPTFGKANNKEFQCLAYPNFLFLMFGKAKIHNSNV